MAKQTSPSPTSTEPSVLDDNLNGKGRSTPTRKEREAARKRPLVPNDRREAARTSRTQAQQARERARIGMAAGDERYLPTRDKGAQRRYVRDYVDARFSVGEILIPVMFLVIIATFLPIAAMQNYAIIALWVFFAIAVLDCIVLSFTVTRKIGQKFGAEKVERGLRWYASMRALQLRLMRLPKPQVKRGQYPA